MLKDFKGQLAITKPKERHRQMREEKKKPEGLYLLTLFGNYVIGWKINDRTHRQIGGVMGYREKLI